MHINSPVTNQTSLLRVVAIATIMGGAKKGKNALKNYPPNQSGAYMPWERFTG